MTVGSHQRPVGKCDERFTPPRLWRPPGPFATDAATSAIRPWSIGGERNITPAENCLALSWRGFGLTWLNPPFNKFLVGAFVLKMCAHNCGVMLLHQRHDAQWWQPINDVAMLQLEVAGRVVFLKTDGSPATIDDPASKHFGKAANSGAAVTLIAFGLEAADRLAAVARRPEYDGRRLIWPDGAIAGTVKLIALPRGVLVLAIAGAGDHRAADASWPELVGTFLERQGGPVSVGAVWMALRDHVKARGRKFIREQIRKVLQQGAGRSVGRDQWVRA